MKIEAAARRPSGSASGHKRRPACGRRLIVAAAVMLLAAACTGTDADTDVSADVTDASPTVPSVVVTTGIWADVVSNVACEDSVSVTTIIPPGGDPHSFEPSLRDREAMGEANLVVANGLTLEERLEDTLEAVAADGVPVFEVGEHIDTIDFEFGAAHDDHDDEDGHADDHDDENGHDEDDGHDDDHDDDHADDHDDEDMHDDEHDHAGGADPHIWFDPQRVAGVLGELADELIHVGADADTVNRCLDAYREALEDADAEIAEILDAIPADRRILITNHDAFGYFADRYDLEVVGTVIPSTSTAAESNPALLEELAEIIEHEGVPAVFSETTTGDDDIQALATAAGDIAVVQLLSGSLAPEGQDGDTLIGLLRFNAHAIANALG